MKLQPKDCETLIYTFTLTFTGGRLMGVRVRGAASLDRARIVAQHALRYRRTFNAQGERDWTVINYAVADGDQTGGAVARFYLWCSDSAQLAQPHPRYAAGASEVQP